MDWLAYPRISNTLRQTYINGFLDVSNVFIARNDASFNGKLYVANTTLFAGDVSAIGNVFVNNNIYEGGQSLISKYATLSSPTFTGKATVPMIALTNLAVSSDASLNGRLFVNGDLSLNGNTYINGNAFLNGNVYTVTRNINDNTTLVATTAYVKQQGYATLTGTETLSNKTIRMGGPLTVDTTGINSLTNNNINLIPNGSGKVHIYSDLIVDGSVNIIGNFTQTDTVINITEQLDISNNGTGPALIVSQYGSNDIAKFKEGDNTVMILKDGGLIGINTDSPVANLDVIGNVAISSDLSLNGRLIVNDVATLNSILIVNGNSSMLGNLVVNQKMIGLSDASINGVVIVNGNMTTNNNLVVMNDSRLNNRLFLVGDASLNSKLFVAGDSSMNGRLMVSQTANFIGDVSMNNRLLVVGDANLNNRLTLVGNATFNSNISVAGNATVGNNFSVVGDATMNSRLIVANDGSFNRNVLVNGDVSMNNRLFVAGNTVLTGKLFIGNDIIPSNANVSLGSATSPFNSIYVNTKTIHFTDNSTNAAISFNTITNSLDVSSNGVTTNQVVSYNGNVAIGKSIMSTNATLDISGSLAVSGTTLVKTITSTSDVSFNTKVSVGGDVSMNGILNVSKNIGINISTPLAPLHVNGGVILNSDGFPKKIYSYNSNPVSLVTTSPAFTLTFSNTSTYFGNITAMLVDQTNVSNISVLVFDIFGGAADGTTPNNVAVGSFTRKGPYINTNYTWSTRYTTTTSSISLYTLNNYTYSYVANIYVELFSGPNNNTASLLSISSGTNTSNFNY